PRRSGAALPGAPNRRRWPGRWSAHARIPRPGPLPRGEQVRGDRFLGRVGTHARSRNTPSAGIRRQSGPADETLYRHYDRQVKELQQDRNVRRKATWKQRSVARRRLLVHPIRPSPGPPAHVGWAGSEDALDVDLQHETRPAPSQGRLLTAGKIALDAPGLVAQPVDRQVCELSIAEGPLDPSPLE